jgi:hypothetical protein
VVDVCDGLQVECARDEVDFRPLDVGYNLRDVGVVVCWCVGVLVLVMLLVVVVEARNE